MELPRDGEWQLLEQHRSTQKGTRPYEELAIALTEVPEAGAGKVLAALEEAIPVLYWETDERLGALRKELKTRAMQQSPPRN